jgi:two-component system, cell cycle response regulator
MLVNSTSTFLLASADPTLLTPLEPLLATGGELVKIYLSAEAALPALTAPEAPKLALIDVNLPGMEMGKLLATARAETTGRRFPIVLISDSITPERSDWLAEGVIDDIMPGTTEASFLRLRLEAVLHEHARQCELERLRETVLHNAQTDRLTGVYNRETMLSMLFRETDRVQRMQHPLCILLFDIDDFGHWNSRLGTEICDELLRQVATRTMHLLRSYDLLGRAGKDEFFLALPGCDRRFAVTMAERLCAEVFAVPFHVAGEVIRLSACFGIASSLGRSPVVVLREAEEALQVAKEEGPESIQCAGESPRPAAAPVTFLSPSSGDELLAW